MSDDTTPRKIGNLATRRVDPKRMLARNRQQEDPTVSPEAPDIAAPVEEAPASTVEAAPAPVKTKTAAPKDPRSSEEDETGYLDHERKEARLREGQLGDLSTHARRLNKAKTAPAPRITENTLIRVAIDLLLSRVDELQGNTEADLRRSLGI